MCVSLNSEQKNLKLVGEIEKSERVERGLAVVIARVDFSPAFRDGSESKRERERERESSL